MSWDVSYLAKICSAPLHPVSSGSFTSKFNKVHSPNLFKERCISEVVRIGSIIIRRLIKLWKAKFFIRCDVIFVVRLQEKFGIDHFGPTAPIITEFQSIRFLQMDSFRQKPTPSPAVLKVIWPVETRRGLCLCTMIKSMCPSLIICNESHT